MVLPLIPIIAIIAGAGAIGASGYAFFKELGEGAAVRIVPENMQKEFIYKNTVENVTDTIIPTTTLIVIGVLGYMLLKK